MKFATLFISLVFGFTSHSSESGMDPVSQIIKALHANPIVHTAVAVAKKDSGSEMCVYSVERVIQIEGTETSEVYQYAATINCGVSGSSIDQPRAQVKVKGRIFNARIDTLELSLDFFE